MENQETKYKASSDFFATEDYEVLSYDEEPEESEDKGMVPYLANMADDALVIGMELAKETGLILLGVVKITRIGLCHLIVTMNISLARRRRVKEIQRLKDKEYNTSHSRKPNSSKKKVVITYEEW